MNLIKSILWLMIPYVVLSVSLPARNEEVDTLLEKGVNHTLENNVHVNKAEITEYINAVRGSVVVKHLGQGTPKTKGDIRLVRLVNKALSKVCSRRARIKVTVLSEDTVFTKAQSVNAGMSDKGHLHITIGALEQLNEGELVAVIDHELSHYYRQDATYRDKLAQVVEQHASRLYDHKESKYDIASIFVGRAQAVVEREQELTADFNGAIIAQLAEYNYDSMASALSKMSVVEADEVYLNHPSIQTRINSLHALKPKTFNVDCFEIK